MDTHRSLKLPPMPADSNELKNLPAFTMQKSEMINGLLKFENNDEGFERALRDGFFLVKIPHMDSVQYGDKFCYNFFLDKENGGPDDAYRGFKQFKVQNVLHGYFGERQNDQVEYFAIEKSDWDRHLPAEVASLVNEINLLAIDILKNVLRKIGVDESEWAKVTGGLSDNKGNQQMNFNHYRPEKNVRGLKFHRDFGFVTVLRCLEPGLIALINEEMFAVNPEDGYFIVNFGSLFELLTDKLPIPVRANIHAVTKMVKNRPDQPNRISYAFFSECSLDGDIYQYDETRKASFVQTFAQFAQQEQDHLYDDPQGDHL